MNVFRSFAIAAVLAALGVAVLGSWVRINGAGMTCPDWPLCNGRIVPDMGGGVILEWSHRLVGFLLGLMTVGLAWFGWRERDRVAHIRPALIALGAVYLLQVILGALTVHLSNSPASVVVHWGAGMLLIATLAAIAVLAIVRPERATPAQRFSDGPGPALAVAATLALVAMCVGAYVSSSYAGAACSTFPTCDGTLLGASPGQFAQMLHRFAAGAFALAATIATIVASQFGSARVRLFAIIGFGLLGVQVALGAANVLGGLPTLLREMHAANAGLTFVAYVIATTCAAVDPVRATARPAAARPARRMVAP